MKNLRLFVLVVIAILVPVAMREERTARASALTPTVKTLQVTIGAGTTQVTTTDTFCKQIFFQNNAAGTMRIGDSTITSSKGVLLNAGPGGGSWTVTSIYGANLDLADYYVNGTSTQILDVACITQ